MLFPKAILKAERQADAAEALAIARLTRVPCGVEGQRTWKVIMQNLPAQSANAPEKVRCQRDVTFQTIRLPI